MKKTAIQFSGGKDSLAVLYKCRDQLDSCAVYFGDTGGIYPHVRAFVVEACEKLGAELRIVKPDVDINVWFEDRGYPSDIVPTESTAEMQPFSKRSGVKLQSYTACCSRLLWLPMQKAMDEDGIEVVVRGVKRCDHHAGLGPTFSVGVRQYVYPLWDWSDGDVLSYLKESGADIPSHYAKANNSFDCILCTAFLSSDGASDRLAYTKENYPKVWPELISRLSAVKSAITSAIVPVIETIESAENLK